MKYYLIFFDLDNTLFDYNKSQEVAFREFVSYFELKYHTDCLYFEFKKINKELWKEFRLGKLTLAELAIQRFKIIFDLHKIKQDPIIFNEYFVKKISESTHLIPYALEICQYIKSQNIKIGVITNGLSKIQKNRILLSGLSQYIETVTTSEECQYFKPHPEIFNCALNKFNHVKKENVLMVGDSLLTDILGAQNFGIDACWFQQKRKKAKDEIKPKFTISALMELKKILNI